MRRACDKGGQRTGEVLGLQGPSWLLGDVVHALVQHDLRIGPSRRANRLVRAKVLVNAGHFVAVAAPVRNHLTPRAVGLLSLRRRRVTVGQHDRTQLARARPFPVLPLIEQPTQLSAVDFL